MNLKQFLLEQEAPLQSILAGAFRAQGTFDEVYGTDKAVQIAYLLGEDVDEPAYLMRPSTPAERAAYAAVLKQDPKVSTAEIHLIRLAGGRKVVHDGSNIVTSKAELDSFVK